MNSQLSQAEQELLQYTKLQQQKEQELRVVSISRQKQLEQILRQRDQKIQQQDQIIQSYSTQITQLKEDCSLQKQLVDQYEQRFSQLKHIIETREFETKQTHDTLVQQVEDLTMRVQKQQNLISQIESDKLGLSGQVKELMWGKDQDMKKYQREITRLKEIQMELEQDHIMQINTLKQEVSQRFNQDFQDKNYELLRMESAFIERQNDYGQEIQMLQEQIRSKEQLNQDQRVRINEMQRKIDDQSIQIIKHEGESQKKIMELELQISRLQTDREHSDSQKVELISDLQKQVQELTLSKDRMEQELKLELEKLLYEQSLTAQKHEFELQKYQASTGHNLQHFQDLLMMANSEQTRLKTELSLIQQSLEDQSQLSKREIDELTQFHKNTINNYDKQLKEFKIQLQFKGKEILGLREQVHEVMNLLDSKNKDIEKLRLQLQEKLDHE